MGEAPHLTLDIDQPGTSAGHLAIPKSADGDTLMLPVISINKGNGPQVLITAGCHGDELEGPILALRLRNWLPEAQISGRIIIVPALNPSAIEAWSRRSPEDGLDLNRVFPGRANGSISERIADAVAQVLLPLVNIVFDLHSFGPKWDFPPATTTHPIADADLMNRTLRMAEAFKLPVTLAWEYHDTDGMFDILVQNQGKIFICAELGSGTVGVDMLKIGEIGIRNALVSLGMIEGETENPEYLKLKSRLTLSTLSSDEVKSPARGIFEPRCSALDEVKQGDVIGVLHPLDTWPSRTIEVQATSTSTICAIR